VSDLVTVKGVAVESASDFNIITVLGKRDMLEEEVVEAVVEGAEGAEGSEAAE
jgi:hypothetical protein